MQSYVLCLCVRLPVKTTATTWNAQLLRLPLQGAALSLAMTLLSRKSVVWQASWVVFRALDTCPNWVHSTPSLKGPAMKDMVPSNGGFPYQNRVQKKQYPCSNLKLLEDLEEVQPKTPTPAVAAASARRMPQGTPRDWHPGWQPGAQDLRTYLSRVKVGVPLKESRNPGACVFFLTGGLGMSKPQLCFPF